MATHLAPRLPANKISMVGGDHHHYGPDAANEALIVFLNGERPRASANLAVQFTPSDKGNSLGFTLLHDAIFPSDSANAPVLDDEGADLGAGGKRGRSFRIRRRKDMTAANSATDRSPSSGDPSRRSGGRTGKSGGGQQNRKRTPTPGMAPGGNSTGG